MEYKEEEYLQLSGLQHFAFCRRQWALIHIEGQWEDNVRTVEGNLLHERAHDSSITEARGDLVSVRGVKIHSREYGISGQCDVLEYHKNENGIRLQDREGFWIPYPVEYKNGIPKESDEDRLQLCGQAMCLEEMLCCDVPEGSLYYGKTRRRERVFFTDELREKVRQNLIEMHALIEKGYTPKVKPGKSCKACSLKDICLPKLQKNIKTSNYIAEALMEDLR